MNETILKTMAKIMTKIKKAIENSEFGVMKLSRKLGVTPNYLYDVMDGKKPLTLGFADRVSKVLGVNVWED